MKATILYAVAAQLACAESPTSAGCPLQYEVLAGPAENTLVVGDSLWFKAVLQSCAHHILVPSGFVTSGNDATVLRVSPPVDFNAYTMFRVEALGPGTTTVLVTASGTPFAMAATLSFTVVPD